MSTQESELIGRGSEATFKLRVKVHTWAGTTGAGRHLLFAQELSTAGSSLPRLVFIRRGRALLRTATTTTAATASFSLAPPVPRATTIPSTTATIATATAPTTAAATLSLLPTDCFMDNHKANEVYDLAYSDEPIAPKVKEALEVIDQALDDFK